VYEVLHLKQMAIQISMTKTNVNAKPKEKENDYEDILANRDCNNPHS
jgi:hypothetical protein